MSHKQKTRFKIGDWIVHYNFGVGKVEDIVEKGVGSEKQTYYKISTSKIDYWLPMDNQDIEYVEPIHSKQDFENALKILSQAPQPIDTQIRSRKNIVHERRLDNSLEGRASLLRDLHCRNKIQKLNYGEKEVLANIRQTFISEWILSDRSKTYEEANERLEKALKIGVALHFRAEE